MGVEAEEIERRAGDVLADVPAWIWNGETLPVPIDAIADSCFDLLVRDIEPEAMLAAPNCPPLDSDHGLSGLFLTREREIWVNADEARQWPPRRRFTIGHELGHCVLHQDIQRTLFCRHGQIEGGEQVPGTPTPVPAERPPLDLIEEEANYFAAAMLMPATLIEHHYHWIGGAPDRFQRMCELFGSSGAAMSRRLRQVI